MTDVGGVTILWISRNQTLIFIHVLIDQHSGKSYNKFNPTNLANMKVIAVIVIFGLSAISATTGLMCFSCQYFEGWSENDDCISRPPDTDLQTCDETRTLPEESTQVNAINNTLLKAIEGRGRGISPNAIGDMYCAKATGAINGDKVFLRNCFKATVEEDMNGKCQTVRYFCQDGACLVNAKVCFCNTDACDPNDNGPIIGTTTTTTTTSTRTTSSPPNAGTSLLSLPLLIIGCLASLS